MDFKTTSSTNRRRGGTTGSSLLEIMVTIGITTIIAGAVMGFSLYTGRSFASLGNYVDLEQRSQMALDRMTQDIRQTQYLTSISSNQLVFRDYDDALLTFRYSPTDRTLTRSKGSASQILLRECDYLSFSNYQRTPIPNSGDQYQITTSPTNSKLVSVTWVCSREITGTKLNTESVQTAKIVIRKQ
jgi:Tfp pilus assembly protein PilW